MARFTRLEVLNEMINIGVVPVFYHGDLETAKNVVAACAAGGARVIEFTNRGDNAYRVFSDLVQHFAAADPSVILGVGSVLDAGTAALYISSGANFVVGPVLNPEVAKVCNRRKVAYSPGCGSASEIPRPRSWASRSSRSSPATRWAAPTSSRLCSGPARGRASCPPAGLRRRRRASRPGSRRAWRPSASAPPGQEGMAG